MKRVSTHINSGPGRRAMLHDKAGWPVLHQLAWRHEYRLRLFTLQMTAG